MIAKIGFYCAKSKKSYKKGDEYKGKRKDLGQVLWTKEAAQKYSDEVDSKRDEAKKKQKAEKARISKITKQNKAKNYK